MQLDFWQVTKLKTAIRRLFIHPRCTCAARFTIICSLVCLLGPSVTFIAITG